MKKCNTVGIHWKIRVLGGDPQKKTIYRGRGGGVKRGLCKKEMGGVCEGGGGDTPMHTMVNSQLPSYTVIKMQSVW